MAGAGNEEEKLENEVAMLSSDVAQVTGWYSMGVAGKSSYLYMSGQQLEGEAVEVIPDDGSTDTEDVQEMSIVPVTKKAVESASSSTQQVVEKARLAPRKDAPVVRAKKRGCLAAALAAGHPDRQDAVLSRLREDEVAKTTAGSKRSRWRTWCRLHENWLPGVLSFR